MTCKENVEFCQRYYPGLKNPMELMNIIRRASAMEDATSPSDAIDQALKAFDEQNPAKIN